MMRVLDLFAGPGGVARGFQRLGFDVVGVDIDPHPAYPAECIEHDLRDGLPERIRGESFAYAWASPPCTPFAATQYRQSGENLIPAARRLLAGVGAEHTVLENVPGARPWLRAPVELEGGPFGLGVRKRRLFETSFRAWSRVGTTAPEFCIGDREHPVEDYREAHGLDRDAPIGAKDVRHCIPPAYVRALVEDAREYGSDVQVALTDGYGGTDPREDDA
jgi:hypothetical protein